MEVIKWVGSIFLAAGLAMLGGAGYSYFKQANFIAAAKSAKPAYD